MLRSIPLKNKPLCIIAAGTDIYVGDARGLIYLLSNPYTCPRVVCEASGPISAMVFGRCLYYGTWDGMVFSATSSMQLGINMVKCLAIFEDRIFASVDSRLFVLDLNLEIVEEYQTESKIHCMDVGSDSIHFGMACGLTAVYTDTYIPAIKSGHEATILCMRRGFSGSTRGSLIKGTTTLYSGEEWIRAVWNECLFSAGKCVIENGKEIYRHDDEVVGLVKVGDTIVSVGLDYCYKVYQGFSLDSQDEEELLQLLNS